MTPYAIANGASTRSPLMPVQFCITLASTVSCVLANSTNLASSRRLRSRCLSAFRPRGVYLRLALSIILISLTISIFPCHVYILTRVGAAFPPTHTPSSAYGMNAVASLGCAAELLMRRLRARFTYGIRAGRRGSESNFARVLVPLIPLASRPFFLHSSSLLSLFPCTRQMMNIHTPRFHLVPSCTCSSINEVAQISVNLSSYVFTFYQTHDFLTKGSSLLCFHPSQTLN